MSGFLGVPRLQLLRDVLSLQQTLSKDDLKKDVELRVHLLGKCRVSTDRFHR
jgi:hypothetical protein